MMGVNYYPLIVLLLLTTGSVSYADEPLPGGVTCEQIVRYAETLHIPNSALGRAQARIIALTFGIVVTGKQLDAAARCLRLHDADKRMGCKHDPDTWECY